MPYIDLVAETNNHYQRKTTRNHSYQSSPLDGLEKIQKAKNQASRWPEHVPDLSTRSELHWLRLKISHICNPPMLTWYWSPSQISWILRATLGLKKTQTQRELAYSKHESANTWSQKKNKSTHFLVRVWSKRNAQRENFNLIFLSPTLNLPLRLGKIRLKFSDLEKSQVYYCRTQKNKVKIFPSIHFFCFILLPIRSWRVRQRIID